MEITSLMPRTVSRRFFAILALQLSMFPRTAFSGQDGSQEHAVFAEPDGQKGVVTARIFIPYEAATPGLAHYAEHLAMLSVLGKAPGEMDPHGSASVSETVMVYWLSGPPEELAGMLKTLASVFAPLELPQAFAETERDIIQHEYDLAVLDNPDRLALEAVNAFLYAGNSLAVSVLGTRNQIKAITYEQAKAFHAATHQPEKAILVVTGEISDRALQHAIAGSGFPAMARRSAIRPPSFSFPGVAEKVFLYPLDSAMPRMIWRKVVMLPEAVQYDALVLRCNLLFNVLISALPGGLPKQLRFDAFIAQSVDLAIFPLDERHAEIRVWLQPDSGVSFSGLRFALETALAQTAAGIPQPTFERVHRRFIDDTPDDGDEKANADNLLDRVANRRLPIGSQRLRALAQQLNKADTEGLLSAVAGPGRLAVTFIGKDIPHE
ncbi:M16 family metallopeptidase [Aestuariivirga sp.]|jgi:hypothetical protein|uniref:M16 family metallopeptidase n=1 Tax=Aestuariivirga sp. TaxID=2650926 RepID=UPI00378476C4